MVLRRVVVKSAAMHATDAAPLPCLSVTTPLGVHYSHLKFRKVRKILRNEPWCVYYMHEGVKYHTVVTDISIHAACDRFDMENKHVKCLRP